MIPMGFDRANPTHPSMGWVGLGWVGGRVSHVISIVETHVRYWELRTAISLTLLLMTFLTTALIQHTTLFIFPSTKWSIFTNLHVLNLHLYLKIKTILDAAFSRLGLSVGNQEILQTPLPTNSKSHSHSKSLLCHKSRSTWGWRQ